MIRTGNTIFSSAANLKNLLLFVLCMMMAGAASGQFYNGSQMSFGKNRVQYKDFYWTFYKFNDFDVYFYLGGQELALYTAKIAGEYIAEMEDKLDTGLEDKIQFIVFNSLSDLKQSNIGLLSDENYNTGGVTHIIGRKVFLYYDGSHRNFDQQVKAGIAQAIVNILLYGNSIGSQIKNNSFYPYPEWYLNGLISFLSDEWNTELDSKIRDGILSGRYDKFNHLSGEHAVYAGHAFWNYISEKHGEASISNIIYMAKVSRKLESGFLYILGISFKNLVAECLDYYRNIYGAFEEERNMPAGSLAKKVKTGTVYYQLKLSPDDTYASYVTNQSGVCKLWLHHLGTGKRKKMKKLGFRLDEKSDYSYPLIAWHPTGKIMSYITEEKGAVYLYYYFPDEKKSEKIKLHHFEKVIDYSYSSDGRKLVMSAVQRGQTDIFVYDVGSNSYEQVTKDHYDDLFPRFIGNSRYILFSSNRFSDTIRYDQTYNIRDTQDNYDLFLYDYQSKERIMRRVTSTPHANEIGGMEYEPGKITFLSDNSGIYNRYLGWFDSTISFVDTAVHYRYFTNSYAITDYPRGILEHDYPLNSGKFGQVFFYKGQYIMQVFDKEVAAALQPVTPGITKYMQGLSQMYASKGTDDTLSESKEYVKRGFYTVRVSDFVVDSVDQPPGKQQTINIRDYNFGYQAQTKVTKEGYSVIHVPLPGQGSAGRDDPPKRLNYNVEYFLNEITTQVDFSFLNATYQPFTGGSSPIYLNPGFSALFKIGVTDLLEDYRITGGVRLNLNLINNEYLLSFANLKKRLDKEVVFHRQAIENYFGYDIVRVYSHELFYILKWPFNPVMSVKGTFSYRNDMTVRLSTETVSLKTPNFYQNWVGAKGELIFDNTRTLGLNLYQGTRYKVFGEQYLLADDLKQNIIVIGLDFRNYQRLSRTFIWANRFAISSSFGNNRLIYYMGGVDNWLVPRFTTTTPIDFSQNYSYQTLATNMRGFNQNIRNGNSFAVLNSELRFPVFRFFSRQPLKSDFLNNFQLVGFGDIGTAWTGISPYSDENFLYTNIIKQNPLHIIVKQQKDPIVGGFGGGVRTRIFGYFLRADLAWGIEDRVVQPSIFYLSLSLDF